MAITALLIAMVVAPEVVTKAIPKGEITVIARVTPLPKKPVARWATGKIDSARPLTAVFTFGNKSSYSTSADQRHSIAGPRPSSIRFEGKTVNVTVQKGILKAEQIRALYVQGTVIPKDGARVEVELVRSTAIPTGASIRPYRAALVAQEYKLTRIFESNLPDLKPGGTLRVLRYGVIDGKQTALAQVKTGTRVTLIVRPLDNDVDAQREYQKDDLDSDFSLTTYVEVQKK